MLEVKNLCFSYPGLSVLEDVGFKAQAGDCVGILGNNGAGKSTLVRCLNRILTPKSGEILLDGQDISTLDRRTLAQKTAYVAQGGGTGEMTVFDCVLLGRLPSMRWGASRADLDACGTVLARLGLTELALRRVDTLSGGQLQKVMLARALAARGRLLLLDEPTGNLDPKNQHETLGLVASLTRREGLCALVVLHDLNLALRYCNKFLLLLNGRVYAYGGAEVVTEETVSAVYGVQATVAEFEGCQLVLISG